MKNYMKQLLGGPAVYLALCLDKVALVLLTPAVIHAMTTNRHFSAHGTKKGITIAGIVKTVLFKLVYSTTIYRLAYLTKKGLSESFAINQDARKRRKHQRIFYFTHIPAFLNFVSTIMS